MVVLASALAMPAAAHAASTYQPAGSFASPGSGTGELTDSDAHMRMAVHDATQQIFLADGYAGIHVFDGSGAGVPSYLTTITGLAYPTGVAIDQGTGELYVSDWGAAQVVRYTSDGAATPTFTQDVTYLGPPAGPPDGTIDNEAVNNFSSPIAIDPQSGELLVADQGGKHIKRFSRGGAYISGFLASEAPSSEPFLDVAVADDGVIHIAMIVEGTALPAADTRSVVARFSADGTRLADLAVADRTPAAVTFDGVTGNTVVAGSQGVDAAGTSKPPVVYVYSGQALVDAVELPAPTAGSRVPTLAVDGTNGRLYALTRLQYGFMGSLGVEILNPVVKPDLSIDAPTEITESGATLRGTIDPLGSTATVHFETSIDGQSWDATPDQVVSTPEAVQARQEGLRPNTGYRVRLVATTADGTIRSAERTFTTGKGAPAVVTGRVTDRTVTTATLRGTVNPYGLQSTYYFEYGPTPAYGARVPVSHSNVAGNGRTPRHVATGITALTPGTTYHYRLVAQNEVGTAAGQDRTFTTRGSTPSRVYEQVSPQEKGGSAVNPYLNFRASVDGSRIAYRWRTAPSGSESAPAFSQSIASRDIVGWSTAPVDPPQLPRTPEGGGSYTVIVTTLGISEDLTKAVVLSKKRLASGATEGQSNLYLRDVERDTFTWMATLPQTGTTGLEGSFLGQSPFLGGSRDFSHVLLGGQPYSLLPGVPNGALYVWSNGELRVASVDENGNPVRAGLITSGYSEAADPSWVSKDGSRIFFDAFGGAVYARVGGTTTVPLSASQRTNDPGALRTGSFVGATHDGAAAFLLSRDLTDDSPAGVPALYRFDMGSRRLTLLVAVNDLDYERVLQVSATGNSVFFASGEDLASGATAGRPNVYVWHDGETQLVATLDPARDQRLSYFRRMASPNGRYYAFSAYSQLSDYDNGSTTECNEPAVDDTGGDACAQVYRYDVENEELVCVSCRPDGGPVSGNAYVGTPRAAYEGDVVHPRVMLDDGRVVFDTPEDLDARDRNGVRDVYLYDDGEPVLISGGHGAGPSELAGTTPDARSIFFTTADQLVPADRDTATDLYVSRVDGGLPAQHPERPREGCVGEDCRAPGAGPSPGGAAPSQAPGRPSEPSQQRRKASVRIGQASFRGTTLRLTADVSGSGRIRVTGLKVATVTRTATKAGSYRLEVKLKKKHRDLRRRGRKVKATVAVKFTPAFGKSVTSKLTRTAAR